MTHPLQLFAAANSTVDAAASIFTPVKARISAMELQLFPFSAMTADAWYNMEISFQSVTQRTVNDATGVLAQLGMAFQLQTSGITEAAKHILISNIDIVWEQSQRVYLHIYMAGGAVSTEYRAILYANW